MPLSTLMAFAGLLRFLLLGGALAALAYLGFAAGGSILIDVVLAIALAGAAVTLWLTLVSPKSTSQLSDGGRLFVEASLLLLAAVAVAASGQTIIAIAFFIAVVIQLFLQQYISRRAYETDPLRGFHRSDR